LSPLREEFMKVRDAVNLNPTVILSEATISEAARVLSDSQASDLMVIDHHRNFIGVLSEGDLIRAALPKIDELASGGGALNAADIFDDKAEALRSRKLTDNLLEAAGLMASRMIRRLPVVDAGKLIGTISRADVCKAILSRAGQ
jgi:CBS domain-containing protein